MVEPCLSNTLTADTCDTCITDNSECPDCISIDFNTIQPLNSIRPTTPYSGHFAWPQQYHCPYKLTLIADTLAKNSQTCKQQEELKASYSATLD